MTSPKGISTIVLYFQPRLTCFDILFSKHLCMFEFGGSTHLLVSDVGILGKLYVVDLNVATQFDICQVWFLMQRLVPRERKFDTNRQLTIIACLHNSWSSMLKYENLISISAVGLRFQLARSSCQAAWLVFWLRTDCTVLVGFAGCGNVVSKLFRNARKAEPLGQTIMGESRMAGLARTQTWPWWGSLWFLACIFDSSWISALREHFRQSISLVKPCEVYCEIALSWPRHR